MEPATTRRNPWLVLAAVLAAPIGCSGTRGTDSDTPAPAVQLTWMGLTNWLIETPETTILLNAYYSRPGQDTEEGVAALEQILAAGGVDGVDHIIIGHSHYDHALDAGTAALATGAQLWGSPTTCLIGQAQGLSPSRCTLLESGNEHGEIPGLTMRVARTPHWSPESDGVGRFEELSAVPLPEAVIEAPNGGVLTLLLDWEGHGSLLFQDTMGALGSDDGSGDDHAANLDAMLRGYDGVDAWLTCSNCIRELGPLLDYFDRIQPRAVVPQHWDSAIRPPMDGLQQPFQATETYTEALQVTGTPHFTPGQIFDRWRLRGGVLTQASAHPAQAALGLSPDGPH